MDFMGNVPTLSEYNYIHSQSFSLNAKMHILIHLSAALKFLSSHQIVHMDLSSLNVVVVNGLLTKIIDFGEAYHPVIDTDSPNSTPFSPRL
jgi:serine/threonine protein kinase